MVREFHNVRKHWPFDLFWKRKKRDILDLEQTAGSPEGGSEPFQEGEYILHHVERVLGALEKRNRARRWLFVKLVLAWLVAYSLTLGEVPWFLVKIWEMVNSAFNGAPV